MCQKKKTPKISTFIIIYYRSENEKKSSNRYAKSRNVINALNLFWINFFFCPTTAWKRNKTFYCFERQFDWIACHMCNYTERIKQWTSRAKRIETKQNSWNSLFTLNKVYLVPISGINIDITMKCHIQIGLGQQFKSQLIKAICNYTERALSQWITHVATTATTPTRTTINEFKSKWWWWT